MKQGWEVKKLGEVCDLMTGGTPSRSKPEYFLGGTIKWLVSGDIHKGEIFDCEGRITTEGVSNSNAKYLPINSVLIALNGQGKTRGTVAMLRTRATCNQSLVSIFPKNISKLLPEYLYCNLHGRYEELRKVTGDSGNDRRGLNMPLIRGLEIPLPPLPEQQRIVAILDETFAAIAKAKANAEQNLRNAKEFFESYLQSVFENKGKGWEEKTLGEVCELKPQKKEAKDKLKETDLVTFLPMEDLGVLNKEIVGVKQRQLKDVAGSYTYFSENDVLLAKITPCFENGKIGIARNLINGVGFGSSEYIVFRSKGNLEPEFLYYFLSRNQIRDEGKKYMSGAVGHKRVSKDWIESYVIPFPASLTEQQTIVQKLDTLSTETKKLETIYQQKLNDLEELKKSILQKAFNGELKTIKEVAV